MRYVVKIFDKRCNDGWNFRRIEANSHEELVTKASKLKNLCYRHASYIEGSWAHSFDWTEDGEIINFI